MPFIRENVREESAYPRSSSTFIRIEPLDPRDQLDEIARVGRADYDGTSMHMTDYLLSIGGILLYSYTLITTRYLIKKLSAKSKVTNGRE